jgi:hypothetical protein
MSTHLRCHPGRKLFTAGLQMHEFEVPTWLLESALHSNLKKRKQASGGGSDSKKY